MKALSITALVLLYSTNIISGQDYELVTSLDNQVSETSGLIYLNNTLITHNDSGNSNQLYEIDINSGDVIRTVTISNVTNIDWEDITYDSTHIYVGDFGNYDGSRTDLRILKIPIADYFNNTVVTAEIINFNYSDQTDFSVQEFATNFDAEAIFNFNDTLYILTKNWVDGNCNIYEVPKSPGNYSIIKIDTVPSQGLVTGATTNLDSTMVILTGYDINGSFLIELTGFNTGIFSNGNIIKTSITVPPGYSSQTESIAAVSDNAYFVSSEVSNNGLSGLYTFNFETLNSYTQNLDKLNFYPNPASKFISLNQENIITQIYSMSGQLLLKSKNIRIDVSSLVAGIYLIKMKMINTDLYRVDQLIIRNN